MPGRVVVALGLVLALVAAVAVLATDHATEATGRPVAAWEATRRSGTTPALTAGAFPVRSVPGAASVAGELAPTLSTSPTTLGVGPRPAALASTTDGPPSWVKPGVRLTFYTAAASVAQSSFAWVEDPDGPWEDPTTGKHYRRTDETGESTGSGSGDGYSQVDVLAVDGTNVVMSLTQYGIDHTTQKLVPGATTGADVPGGEVDGTWINPTELAQLQDAHHDGLLVLRGDYPLNGTTYKAVSFATTTPGAYQQYTYDTQSGVLLSETSSTAAPPSPVTTPGQPPAQGNQELTVAFFAGARLRTVPGLTGVNPDWVVNTSQLDFTGTYYWTNPVGGASAGALTSPMTMGVTLRPGGDAWGSDSVQTYIQQINYTSTGSGVTGPTGLYWLSPQALTALAAMSPGQVVDKDPITGEQVVMRSVGRDPETGRTLLTLVSTLPGITTVGGYDTTTGVLAAYAAQVPASGTTIDLRLQDGP